MTASAAHLPCQKLKEQTMEQMEEELKKYGYRMKFPAKSGSLATRWCSSVLKIMVADSLLRSLELEELKSRVPLLAGLDTLEYLAKGGRLSKSAAAIGEALCLCVLEDLHECLRRGLGGLGKLASAAQDFIKFVFLKIHAVYVVLFPDCDMDGDKFQIFFFDLLHQMNRTLQSMEDKGLIERTRSTLDKRQVFLWLNTDSPAFRTQHEKSHQSFIVGHIRDKLCVADGGGQPQPCVKYFFVQVFHAERHLILSLWIVNFVY